MADGSVCTETGADDFLLFQITLEHAERRTPILKKILAIELATRLLLLRP